VEKWRNAPRACCLLRIPPLQFSANFCLGLSTDSKNEPCQFQFTSEQQPSQHDCAFIVFGKLLLVLHELCDASAGSSDPAPPQLRHKRWDDILKQTKTTQLSGSNRTILVKKEKCQYLHFYRPRVCALRTLRKHLGEVDGARKAYGPCQFSRLQMVVADFYSYFCIYLFSLCRGTE